MPGVLVDFASSSSSSSFFPFEPGSALPCPALGNAAFEMSDEPYPPSPIPTFGLLCSSTHPLCQIPTQKEDLHWACHPKCSLELTAGGNVALQEAVVAGMGSSPELKGLPIPSPRKNFYGSSSSDSMVSSPSPIFSDMNGVGASAFSDAFAAFQKFLPSNNDEEVWPADAFPAMDVYSCDDFRMYEFKVRRCMRGRSHDWTECPFAHPGEKARRRDPRRFHYSGTACPDFRKGSCKRGEACEFAHGVFECWLHPARYRTQPCKDGRACRRRVCFFAHSTQQLRVLPSAMAAAAPLSSCLSSSSFSSSGGMNSPSSSKGPVTSYDGSPLRQLLAGATLSECSDSRNDQVPRIMQKMMESKSFGHNGAIASSPTSTLYGHHATSPPSLSPSLSPSTSPPLSPEPFTSWPRNVNSTPGHYPQSPLSNSSPAPAHRRHLNRLQSVPTILIPPAASDLTEVPPTSDDLLFGSPTITGQSPCNGMSELLHSLQTLQLRSRVAELQRASSTPATPLSHKWSLAQQSSPGHCLYRSNPAAPLTPEGNVEVQAAERVESGRSLRAEIYGKIGRDNGIGGSSSRNEGPDLGWVNELVK